MNLNSIFSNIKSRDDKELSALSKASYISKLNRVAILCTKSTFNDDAFLKNHKHVIKCINESGLKNPKDYFAAIIKYIRHTDFPDNIIETYSKEMNQAKKTEIKARGNNQAKDIDIARVGSRSLQDIQKAIEDYSYFDNGTVNKDKLTNKLILALYFINTNSAGLPILVPRNDLPVFKIISISRAKKSLPDSNNYLIITDNKIPTKITMKNYKTSSKYGTQSFQISDNITNLLQTYLLAFNKVSGDFLFTNKDNLPYKNSTFLTRIKKASRDVLNTDLGIDLIRQIILTNTYNNHPLMTINEKNELARGFLHSSNVGQEYVRPELVAKK
jgi:hypothetical protein